MNDEIISGAQIQREAADAKRSMDALAHHVRYNALAHYRASEPAKIFHASHAKERMLTAGSQQGKSFAISREVAMHLCNRYAPDWAGRRFDTIRPGVGANTLNIWVASSTNAALRHGAQLRLLGDIEAAGSLGTEAVPASSILSVHKGRGLAGLCDYFVVKRDPTILPSGERIDMGTATCRFLSYEMSRDAWQAASVDLVWFDEQPGNYELYLEGFARTLACGKLAGVCCSLTPLGGWDRLIERYFNDPTPERQLFKMAINSEGMYHISKEDRLSRIAQYENDKSMTDSERNARLYGFPSMAEGAIYTTPLNQILINDPLDMVAEVSKPYVQVWGGCDFNHMGVSDQSSPAAFVILSRDENDGVVRVVDAWKMPKASISSQIQRIREHKIGSRIRWHWPQDGGHGSGDEDGTAIKERFKKGGILMHSQHARTAPPGNDRRTATGIGCVRELLLNQKFFVPRRLVEWHQEYSTYCYNNGKPSHAYCDLMDATRTAVVDMRFAKTLGEYDAMRYGGSTDGRKRKVQIADGVDPDAWGA